MDDLWTTYRQPIDNLRTTYCAYINWQYNSKLFTHSLTNDSVSASETCTDGPLRQPLVGANAGAHRHERQEELLLQLGSRHHQHSPLEQSERRRLRHRRPPTIPAKLVEKAVACLSAQSSAWVRDVIEERIEPHHGVCLRM